MTIGLALIAKDEEKRLPELLRSIEGAFDQIVLVDTGSIDRTVSVFKEWAREQENLRIEVEHFKWTKDFGAARRAAQALLDTDWEVWADCDDVIVGAQNLRLVAQQAPEHIAGFIAGYNYAQHPQTGDCICYLKRERLVRRGAGTWMNRVHEAQVVNGMVQHLGSEAAEWIHRKQATSIEDMQAQDARRNLDILDDWVKDEPENTRVLAYLGTEHAARGEIDEALEWFQKYTDANPEWDEERAQICRKQATCFLMKDQPQHAIDAALQAIQILPTWTDSYNTLAEAYYMKGEHGKSVEWAREALRRGEPDTLLIINPLDYSYQPRKVLAGSLAALGNVDEAISVGTEALKLNPMDDGLMQAIQEWRATSKKEHTANTIAMMAQQLIAHDEQLKAMMLLDSCVPHFCLDHPGVVQLRSQLRERLAWVDDPSTLLDHYETGGSKPEDFLQGEDLERVPAALPRVQFLYQGLHDQLLEAHREGLIQEAEKQLPKMLEAISGQSDPS